MAGKEELAVKAFGVVMLAGFVVAWALAAGPILAALALSRWVEEQERNRLSKAVVRYAIVAAGLVALPLWWVFLARELFALASSLIG